MKIPPQGSPYARAGPAIPNDGGVSSDPDDWNGGGGPLSINPIEP